MWKLLCNTSLLYHLYQYRPLLGDEFIGFDLTPLSDSSIIKNHGTKMSYTAVFSRAFLYCQKGQILRNLLSFSAAFGIYYRTSCKFNLLTYVCKMYNRISFPLKTVLQSYLVIALHLATICVRLTFYNFKSHKIKLFFPK